MPRSVTKVVADAVVITIPSLDSAEVALLAGILDVKFDGLNRITILILK